MALKKQQFYEGAALHLLARAGGITGIRYEGPFFFLNDHLSVFLKYCTKGRSPWGFTFTADEQNALRDRALQHEVVIGLICGADGVVALPYDAYASIATTRDSAIRVSCYRQHNEQYEINGPDGRLTGKVPPSNWQRILRH